MSVYLEVDGKPIPAKDCVWIETAPCGCVAGVMTAQSGTDLYATEEQARLHMAGNKVAMKRSIEEGLQFRLITRETFRAMPFDDCTHTPKWGWDHPAPPEGWQWGTTDGAWGRQTHIKHMVPVGCIPVRGEKYPDVGAKALCGKAVRDWWKKVDGFVDCVSCKKCDTQARGGAS